MTKEGTTRAGGTRAGTTIVVDIGKTLSKLTLWSRGGVLIDRQVRPNQVIEIDGIRRLDAEGIGAWIREGLARWADRAIETIVPVAHGAGFAALDGAGADAHLLFPPLDYEQPIPEAVRAAYHAERDPFALTGSPALPDGLNLGTQVYWMAQQYPEAMARATLVPWAQYWAWFLSGAAVSEVTSLGCHSDLWAPEQGTFSPMAVRLGWATRFAPLARAADTVGTLRPDLAAQSGLSPEVRVLAGLHDSNAALLAARGLPEIANHEATILSTGTWFIAMRLAREAFALADLPDGRDTLVNVDAYGQPVPSARFMGGREIETVIQIDTRRIDIRPDQPLLMEAVPALLERRTMMMPSLTPGFGPYPSGRARWINAPVEWAGTWYARRAAICLYAAMVADTALDLIGAKDRLLIEGRFCDAEVFVRALAALRPDTEVYIAHAHNDVSFGALRLIDPDLTADSQLRRVEPLEGDLSGYRAAWHAQMRELV
ncbi:FGGY family carbohydrate kinase [Novosphingobium sp. 1949]|uniref:FGGY family carbohydrate kinase n=1 Tax=Novosphingobium organovorum TaxID=2930092 RepID=A0ABT0BEH0_9SPHN|nr:FGGY family carbohydrate kinase [Novosphingobium organovorum]MCJ2183463.1 FGGY family carbohydrate kinase [Novosphingobium organovorum]